MYYILRLISLSTIIVFRNLFWNWILKEKCNIFQNLYNLTRFLGSFCGNATVPSVVDYTCYPIIATETACLCMIVHYTPLSKKFMNQIKKNVRIPWFWVTAVFFASLGADTKVAKKFSTLKHVITDALASSITASKAILKLI